MIPHWVFEKIRLHKFVDEDMIDQLENWEYLGLIWVGEGCYGFSDCLQLHSSPGKTRCLDLDLNEMPPNTSAAILEFIELPLYGRMTKHELDEVLGTPYKETRFVQDRCDYHYFTPNSDKYEVVGTIRDGVGLTFVTVLSNPDELHALSEEHDRKFR